MTIIMETTGSPIQRFYTGQNVFITGGTGFLGKILIEKLLRSCPDVATIYLLVRPKKGLDVNQRIENLFEDVIFQRLKDEAPKFRHKVVAVAGDCTLPGLGLSLSDKQLLLRETSIVFNVAATVRFDENIQDAVAVNIQGTKETLTLCGHMQELMAVVHVSTAYSNCTKNEIDEKVYDSPMNGDDLIKLVQSADNGTLKAMTKTLLHDFPNTYTYTKQIAEQIVLQYGKGLPVGIFRPAIVISTYKEPLEGWIDNVFGPTGVLVGGGMGLVRTIHTDASCTAELVPVDFAVNALIASAWDVASNKNEAADPPVYNYVSSWDEEFTWGEYIDLALLYASENPSLRSMWYYSVTPITNYFLYQVVTILLHIIPGMLVDLGLFLTGRPTKMLKIYSKIHKFSLATAYFSTQSWRFKNDMTKALWARLTVEDKKLFRFSMENFDWRDFMEKSIIGLRLYVLKDDPSTIPAAKNRMAKFFFFHCCIKYAFIGFALYLVYYCYLSAINFKSI